MCWLTNVTFLPSPDTSFTFFLLSPGHWLSYLILLIKKRCITVSCTHCTYWTLYTLYTLWIQSVSHTGLFPGTYSESIQFQLQSSHQNTYTVQIVLVHDWDPPPPPPYWQAHYRHAFSLYARQTDICISDGPGVRSPFERRLRHFRWPVHSTFALSFGYHKIFHRSRQVSGRCHDQDEGPVRPYILLFCRNTECSAHLRKRHIK